jgi:hypothetical protein
VDFFVIHPMRFRIHPKVTGLVFTLYKHPVTATRLLPSDLIMTSHQAMLHIVVSAG